MAEPPVLGDPGPSPQFTFTDLNDEHTDFLKGYQSRFDAFHFSQAARKRGSQKLWVVKNVMGDFQWKFGQCSDSRILLKIDRYFRNRSRYTQNDSEPVVVPPTVPRAVNWTQVMARDNKDVIQARIADIRNTEGGGLPKDNLRHFHRARREMADLLSDTEVEYYRGLAEVELESLKAPPTPEVIFNLQPNLSKLVSTVIQKRLGWKTGQFGDVICFFAVAYRTENQDIKTQFSFASNHRIPKDEMIVPALSKDFTEHANPHLKRLADKYIPCTETQQPQLELDVDEVSPKVLQETLLQHIVTSWIASSPKTCRTTENLPWAELGTVDGRELYLMNHTDFEQLNFFCPTSAPSHDVLCKFAMKVMSAHPLFKPPQTSGTSPSNSPAEQDPPDLALSDVNPDDVMPAELKETPSSTPMNEQPPQQVEPKETPSIQLANEHLPQSSTPLPTRPSTNRPSFTSTPPLIPVSPTPPTTSQLTLTNTPQPTTPTAPPPVTPTTPQPAIPAIPQPAGPTVPQPTLSAVGANKRKRGKLPMPPRQLRNRTVGAEQTTTIAVTQTKKPRNK